MHTQKLKQLRWRSRRGMLELDALFQSYLEVYGDKMTDQEIENFELLLEEQDQQLFDAFSGKQPLADKALQNTLSRIIDSQS